MPRLTKNNIKQLAADVGERLRRGKCDRTLAHTQRCCGALECDWDQLQVVLEDRGAYCDCEVAAKLLDAKSDYQHRWPASRQRFPRALDPARVGSYPAIVHAGGGYVWDAVLEYRVWCSPEAGAPDVAEGDDYYFAFASYPAALQFAETHDGADEPIALVLQKQYLDEPRPGKYVHVKKRRLTEWPVEFLARPRRTRFTIPDFLSPTAPANRLDILRGLTKTPRRKR